MATETLDQMIDRKNKFCALWGLPKRYELTPQEQRKLKYDQPDIRTIDRLAKLMTEDIAVWQPLDYPKLHFSVPWLYSWFIGAHHLVQAATCVCYHHPKLNYQLVSNREIVFYYSPFG